MASLTGMRNRLLLRVFIALLAAVWSVIPLLAGRSTVVLTTLGPHRRSREQVAQRYAASTSRAKRNLPSGVESIVLRGAGETMFWLPKHRTLVPGNRILGARDGGLRLCPESWLYWVRVDRDELRTLLKPLLDFKGVSLRTVPRETGSGWYVHDRRNGSRQSRNAKPGSKGDERARLSQG